MITSHTDRQKFYTTTIPLEWDMCELIQVSEKIMVGIASAATHAYRSEGIILFRNQNIKEGYLADSDILHLDENYEKAHKNKRLKGGDILIARTGYPGTACIVPDKYFGSQSFTTLIVRPKHGRVNKEFLCLYINSEFGQGYFETNQIGGGQKNVNAGTLETMPIPVPPLLEQKAIATLLSKWDETISKNQALIQQKEERKKWLMQNLLTGKKRLRGFDGEWEENKLEYFIDELKQKPKITDSFEVLTSAKSGLMKQTDYYGNNRITNRGDADYNVIPPNYLTYRSRSDDGLFTFNKNDLGITGLISGYYPVFKIKNGNIDFILMCINYFKRRLTKYSIGTSQLVLAMNALKEAKFKLPDYKEQTAIAKVLQAVDKELQLLKTKTEKLKEQKKGLMQVLLTGKKRLKID